MADLSITPEGAPRTFAHAAPATTVIALVVGLIVGAGAGVFAIGPMLAKRLAPAPALATVGGAAGSDARADDALPADRGAVTIHLIDNLVLNPANAGGAAFPT